VPKPTLSDVVARNIAAERARRRWKQADLAERLGVAESTVGSYETGGRRVNLDMLPDFCRAFDISLAKLLDGADPGDLAALRIDLQP
jgi:transcriptional regulator with XRE-family HTH domain